MFGCLLFKNTLLNEKEIKQIVTEFIAEENIDISVECNFVVVNLNFINHAKLWQLVLNFEIKKTLLGYGIDEDKGQARNKAVQRLNEIEMQTTKM